MRFFSLSIFVLVIMANSVFASTSFLDDDAIQPWARPAIETLVQKGILKGNDDGKFAPNRLMNRAEFCKTIVNATGVLTFLPFDQNFPDVNPDDWFFEAVETARYHGWIDGYPDGTFKPANTINRAEVAKIMFMAFGLNVPAQEEGDSWSDPYFRALDASNLLARGSSLGDRQAGLNPGRAEIAQQVYRFLDFTGKLDSNDVLEGVLDLEAETSEEPEEFEVPMYEYNESGGNIIYNEEAGDLYLKKTNGLLQRVYVDSGQKGVKVHSLDLNTTNGLVDISGFKFRIMGGGATDFVRAWLEINDKIVSDKVGITGDIVEIPFLITRTFGSSLQKIVVKADISYTAQKEKSSRFVLYLPEWVEADTISKIGFFPFGGTDVMVK